MSSVKLQAPVPRPVSRTVRWSFRFAVLLVIGCVLVPAAQAQPLQLLEPIIVDDQDPDDLSGWYRVDVETDFQRRFQTLEDLIAADRTLDAATALQSVIDYPSDFVVVAGEAETSLKRNLIPWVEELSSEILKAYDTQFDPDCRHLIEQWEKTGDPSHLQEASRRYLHTKSGGKAAYKLANYYLDQGNFTASLLLFQRLMMIERHAKAFSPALDLQTAICISQLLSVEQAKDFVKERLGDRPVTIGGQQRSGDQLREFLTARHAELVAQANAENPTPPMNWAMYRRNAARKKHAAAYNMLPEQSWQVDLVSQLLPDRLPGSTSITQLIEALIEGLHHRELTTLPAWHPIIVDDRVIVSSFGNVAAFSRDDGQLLWKSSTGDRVFEFLLNESLIERANVIDNGSVAEMREYIWQHLVADLVSSTLSSDGERVYAVRGNGLATTRSVVGIVRDASNVAITPTDSNLLTAYDLKTGQLRWQIGGIHGQGGDPDLAGHYFLGPPTVVNNSLFVMTENGAELFLVELDGRTGKVLWLQPLAHPLTPILEDRPRRLAGAMPTYVAPYLICSTNAGSVIAIDLHLRELAWMMPYLKFENTYGRSPFDRIGRRGARSMQRAVDLLDGDHWQDTAPVVCDDVLLVTPTDSQDLIAIDLHSGQQLWLESRQDGLYVDVSPNGEILLVGKRSVRGLSKEGNEVWTLPLAGDPPAGRGVFRGNVYDLPLQSDELWSIDPKTGKLLAASQHSAPLGNLFVSEDQLHSVGGGLLTAFKSLSQLQQEVAPETKGTRSASQLALEGQLFLHQGDLQQGLSLLQQAYALEQSPQVARQITRTLLTADGATLELDEDSIQELARLMVSTDHSAEMVFRYVQALRKLNRPVQGYDVVRSLVDSRSNSTELISVTGTHHVSISSLAGGMVLDLYQDCDDKQRQELLSSARELLQKTTDSETLQHYHPLFMLPGLEVDYRLAVARVLDTNSNPLLLERHLIWLISHGTPEAKAESLARMTELLLKRKQIAAASRFAVRLQDEFAETPALNQQTGQQLIAKWKTQHPELQQQLSPAEAEPPRYAYDVKVEPDAVAGSRGDIAVTVPLKVYQHSPWEDWTFSLLQTLELITGFNERGEEQWQFHLGTEIGRSTSHRLHLQGHLGIFQTDGEIYGLNGFDLSSNYAAKPSWSMRYGSGDLQGRGFLPSPVVHVLGPTPLMAGWSVEAGQLTPPVDQHLPIRDGDRIRVINPLTGATQWEMQRPESEQPVVWADHDSLFILPSSGRYCETVRLVDGGQSRKVDLPIHDELRALSGSVVVLWERINMQSGRVLGFDLKAGRTLWSLNVSGSIALAQLDNERLVLFDVGPRSLRLLDPRSENPVFFTTEVADSPARSLYVTSDPQTWYVHLTSKPESTSQNLGLEAGMDVNGPVIAISRNEPRKLWESSIDQLRWIPGQSADLPFLIYGAKVEVIQRDENGELVQQYYKPTLRILDKQSGDLITELPEEVTGTLMRFAPDFATNEFTFEFTSGAFRIQATKR